MVEQRKLELEIEVNELKEKEKEANERLDGLLNVTRNERVQKSVEKEDISSYIT